MKMKQNIYTCQFEATGEVLLTAAGALAVGSIQKYTFHVMLGT
jgi:hypothetical protein